MPNNNIIIEAELVEEESLNEAVVLKFVSKEDVPEEFKKFSIGLVKDLQDACGNKKLQGPGLMVASYGISFGNIVEKIEKKEKKNLYTIRMSIKAANAAIKDQRKR